MARETVSFGLVILHRSNELGFWFTITDVDCNHICNVNDHTSFDDHPLADDISDAIRWARKANLDEDAGYSLEDLHAEWSHTYTFATHWE